MGMFAAFQIAGSALNTYRTWLDAISDNIANMNTTTRTSEAAFQARTVEQAAIEGPDAVGSGVRVTRVALGDPNGIVVSDPSNPLADAQGMVRKPNIDMGEQMTNMLVAQRSYQVNISVISRAREIYQQAMQIGR